ncbi:5-formyltetrahydrofolate cyclo-ligase family protein [Variibacter gotjawalensis]|uniref:5-formyltetrahydrofolate cyclo-ligase n=2 Tax=Variibacter gotjawalensis TaxID=1333996 RepID=A0A0S3Q0H3_9BRAD|nr:5-formyltetrahydrofolate cyclo-ligase [Variibacter gotjawalensis]RZS49414.1 5-formyltetrahydrofolate cyclo-ligase [Variibacter gotjawalensis]BAT61677.1 5-formyltetrahydrofolate cyclo-ligase family protein [Variibacter gotjawalensis]
MVTPARPAAVKVVVRTEALMRRDALSGEDRARAAEVIAARGFPLSVGGQRVSGFMPIRTEINPLPLMRRGAEEGASLALPIIRGRGQPLDMHEWSLDAPLEKRQWGIREPAFDSKVVYPDIVLTPLAAFDRRGYRIGYGAGYFDMTLNELRARKSVIAIGLAFACQEVETVPIEPHDARLDFVLTERDVIDCREA